MREGLQVDGHGGIAADGVAVGRIVLMAGHAGDGIVQHNHRGNAPVVGDIHQPGDAGMAEGGVADHRHGPGGLLLAPGGIEAVKPADGRAHADADVDGGQRRGGTQGIAADIAADIDLQFFQGVKQAAVGTAGAEHGRPGRDVAFKGVVGPVLPQQGLPDGSLAVFADGREQQAADDRHAMLAAVGLDDVVQLLDDIDLADVAGELHNQADRQGVDHAQLEEAGPLAQGLLGVCIGGTGTNDADTLVVVLDGVDGGGFRPPAQGLGAFFHLNVGAPGHGGHHDVFHHVLMVLLQRTLLPGRKLHQGTGMGNPGGQA